MSGPTEEVQLDGSQRTVARTCLAASYDGSMAFPDIVRTLIEAGFEAYIVDYRASTTTYYLPSGDSVAIDHPSAMGMVAPDFDQDALKAAVREAQTGAPGYTYEGFCEKAKRAGCAGYFVSFPGRRAVYFGRTAETHVEHFPQ